MSGDENEQRLLSVGRMVACLTPSKPGSGRRTRTIHGHSFSWGACLCVILSVVLGSAHAQTRQRKTTVYHKGDLNIGAMFSLHNTPNRSVAITGGCGEIREQYGIQRVEATFMTIDRINRDPHLLPNISLGVEIRDSCWHAPIALEQTIEFIQDTISNAYGTTSNESSPDSCSGPHGRESIISGSKNLIGVLGPGSSELTIQVQNLLQIFQIPQIGYSATSRDLSDKSRFNYFLRVVPSDYYQAQVMVDVVTWFNWTYVSVVNTDGNYGQSGIQAFRELSERAGICIAKEDSILENAEDAEFDAVIRRLRNDSNAKVVVCFCQGQTVRGLLKASQRNSTGGREFLFVGSDGWADRSDVVQGLETAAEGSISIRIHAAYVQDFDKEYFKLNASYERNPWFREFWEYRFNCSLNKTSTESNPHSSKPLCTGREKLDDRRYKQDTKMAFIIKAIYAMAHGLHDMQRHLCKGKGDGLCQEMFPFNGSLYKNFLLNVSFTYGEGDEKEQVTFDAKGDPPGRYDIMNYRYLENRTHDYVQIGTWDDGNLTLNATLIDPSAGQVKSVCSTPCPLGQRKNYQIGGQEKRCCWSCVKCLEYQFLSNEETCQDCPQGFWPNPNLTDCEPIEQETIEWGNRPAIVALILSGNGFLATLFTLVVFVAHNNTPVVKSSTRELTYIIFLGMCLCYATTFPMLAKPSQISCTLSRILPGLSFALIYAALLTKTNRIARILAGSKKKIITRKPRFMSGPAQVLITLILIGVEVGIVVTMLVLEPPKDEPHYPSKDRVILVCNTTTWGMMAPLCFDFFLLGLSTIYAMKTRNVPENYNEAKFIGFSVYTTVVIWIAFIPIYFNSDHLTATITLCYCMSLSGLVTLVLLFFPRLYIILCRPERNNRSEFITATTVRCHIGNSSGYSRTSTSLSVCEATERSMWRNEVHEKRSLMERWRLGLSKAHKDSTSTMSSLESHPQRLLQDSSQNKGQMRRSPALRLNSKPSQESPLAASTPSEAGKKRRFSTMLRKAYGSTLDISGSQESDKKQVKVVSTESQTGDDLLLSYVPSIRRRLQKTPCIESETDLFSHPKKSPPRDWSETDRNSSQDWSTEKPLPDSSIADQSEASKRSSSHIVEETASEHSEDELSSGSEIRHIIINLGKKDTGSEGRPSADSSELSLIELQEFVKNQGLEIDVISSKAGKI